MGTDPLFDLEQLILGLLDRQGKDYLTIKQVVAGLPAAPRRRLALSTTQPTTALVHKLTPHLGKRLQVYKGSRSTYIGHRLPLETLILRRIQQRPGVSSKQLGTQLPAAKTPYLAALNALLQSGAIVCTLTQSHTPCLLPAETPRPLPASPSAAAGDARAAFKAAYDEVGQGRDFVRIHRLRDILRWPRARFDQVLADLRADYTVELHGGDPSLLTPADVYDSFQDAHGTLYITLSWRGQP